MKHAPNTIDLSEIKKRSKSQLYVFSDGLRSPGAFEGLVETVLHAAQRGRQGDEETRLAVFIKAEKKKPTTFNQTSVCLIST